MSAPWDIDLSIYDDEEALLAALRRRERFACTCLLKRYGARLYRLALQMTGDPDEAEDVLQEALIRACDAIDRFEGASQLGTWLHRIVLNTALMHLRRSKRTVSFADSTEDDAVSETADQAAGPADTLLSGELRNAIDAAVLRLPDTLRAAFVLREIEGLSTREAAEALGISESALKVRLHRARQALQASLAPWLADADSREVRHDAA